MGTYHFWVPAKNKIQVVENQGQVKYTNDMVIPGGSKDFVLASEKTVNAVVHIKTVSKKTNTSYSDPFQQFFFGNP